ncbi:hypothetical protein [Kitasatospora sp. CB02891]|uniref:hypothetical protein n=1 Tax=Kitasatospora sp. CB02891 TaxID=2020329 RepID=UPI0012FDDBEB|nr:hypothetical protein [Kitasatospora sp. CB02891]
MAHYWHKGGPEPCLKANSSAGSQSSRRRRRGERRTPTGTATLCCWRTSRESCGRLQVGENGDGADLRTKADRVGDAVYSAAMRLFSDEERNRAWLLAELLDAGHLLLNGQWSDKKFVRVCRPWASAPG